MPRSAVRHDVELMLVVLFWAFNVTVVKICLSAMEPLAFNLARFGCAAAVLLALTLAIDGPPRLARRDAAMLALLGALGHTLYQLCFVLGLARTSASSTALIFGSTPVVVALLSRVAGHERVGWRGAAAAGLAFAGVFLIVQGGGGPSPGRGPGSATAGDLLVVGAVICWSGYTVLSRDLLTRHSPLRVTALSLSFGTLLMVPVCLPAVLRQDWGAVPVTGWIGIAYSFLFALVISYILWYRSVRAVGNLRTALYSNLVPVFGTLFGVWLLGERLGAGLASGGACILGGILLTRLGPPAPAPQPPVHEAAAAAAEPGNPSA
ncbi:MAG TPA: DMT family transporter [Candidatus Polarisedimenticolia bacterium]|nr:DMT family transporter [Candidatus Polarisedimenticolia bacterium]